MTFWKRLFGQKKEYMENWDILAGSLSEEASNCISDALSIIESQVDIKLDMISIESTGAEGKIMEAVEKFKAALKLHPENPLLHYAYASSLDLGAQHKSCEEELKKCAEMHPDFILAKLALEGYGIKWLSMFTLPPFGLNTETLHPALSQIIKTNVLRPVRDVIVPRATIFMRDGQDEFKNLSNLQSVRIDLASVISPLRAPQIIGICIKIYDDPSNPFISEVLGYPFKPRGDRSRSAYEYLCIQKDIDFVIIDNNDRILLNKRLVISKKMQATNAKIFKMLEASDGVEISPSQLMNALMIYQQRVEPSDVSF